MAVVVYSGDNTEVAHISCVIGNFCHKCKVIKDKLNAGLWPNNETMRRDPKIGFRLCADLEITHSTVVLSTSLKQNLAERDFKTNKRECTAPRGFLSGRLTVQR